MFGKGITFASLWYDQSACRTRKGKAAPRPNGISNIYIIDNIWSRKTHNLCHKRIVFLILWQKSFFAFFLVACLLGEERGQLKKKQFIVDIVCPAVEIVSQYLMSFNDWKSR
uniref:Uncharacterized protein n=1 Tax=Glossina austeni TaxID=7395 RepID=A0A1A9VLF8_GLOAU